MKPRRSALTNNKFMSIGKPLDETPKPATILLKGGSGTGKTFKAAQFQRPTIFSFDNNLSGLRKLDAATRAAVRIVDPRSDEKGQQVKGVDVWGNFVKQLAVVVEDPTVDTVVIDSLTTMAECLMDKIIATDDPGKRIEIQHWGDFSRYMAWLGDSLMCASDLDKTVIIIAHEQLHEEELSKKVKYLLNVGGKTKESFDLYFTDVWRTYTKPGKDNTVEYWIRTLPTDYHSAKVSLNLPGDFKWDDKKADILQQVQSLKKP